MLFSILVLETGSATFLVASLFENYTRNGKISEDDELDIMGAAATLYTGTLVHFVWIVCLEQHIVTLLAGVDTVCCSLSFCSTAAEPLQTTSVIETFMLAMVHNPDVYRKTQEEIDRVIGNERLPEIADRKFLPYFEAIMKELYR